MNITNITNFKMVKNQRIKYRIFNDNHRTNDILINLNFNIISRREYSIGRFIKTTIGIMLIKDIKIISNYSMI